VADTMNSDAPLLVDRSTMGDSEFVNADWQLATGFAVGRTRRSKKEHGVDVFQSPVASVISNPYFDLRYY
jgi:hypothetical protein